MLKAAILDDYQNVALSFADWSQISGQVELTVFNKPLGPPAQVIAALQDFDIVLLTRERTPFPAEVINGLPKLKFITTSGPRNRSIDTDAAARRGIPVCGTEAPNHPTAELTFGLMLELARRIGYENHRLKSGEPWQTTIGTELFGKTLGIVGLGRLGGRVAQIAQAFGMTVIAWSQNLTQDKATPYNATAVTKDELFRRSDFVTVHMILSPRSTGLIGMPEFEVMKPSAYFLNTSRGPIADEKALETVLRAKAIAGAALDTFNVEPLPLDHPFRKLDNLLLTPHLGYVTQENYRVGFAQRVENVRAWLDGKPIRVITPETAASYQVKR